MMEGPTLSEVLKEEKNEDSIEYFIFPPTAEDPEGQLFNLNAAAQKSIGDYLWHSDPFRLRIPSLPISKFDETKPDDDSSFHFFHGITRYGDNVEDEWFLVYVLQEISKQFPGVVIRVIDNDGEFLLIEGADHLPSWAESDSSCRQRVYIFDGKIHLIPKGDKTANSHLPEGTPSIRQAVDIIRSHPELTLANAGLQKAIKSRVGNYPDKMKMSWHYSNLMLPPKLAAILKERPTLVAPGVLAFYFRDPVELKATRLMKNFTPARGLVKTRLRFTRCLYAMLLKQEFRPDTRTGWNYPRPTSADFKAHNLGAKLTTGFEILLSRSGSQIDDNSSDSIDQSAGWLRYEETLKKTGYFRDYLEGSKPYQQLQNGAKDFYRNNLIGEIQPNEDCVSRDVKNLLKTVPVNMEKLVEDSKNLPEDDDDAWMNIKPEDLESLLEAQFQSINLNPQEIPLKLKEFIEEMSDFSGIELSGSSKKQSRTNTTNGTGAGDVSNVGDFGEPVDFRADDFVSAMDKLLLELGATDKEWEDSDDSYGSEEDDFDVNLEEIKKMHSFSKDSKMHELMQEMDDELATTEVGKSFIPEGGAVGASASSSVPSSSSQRPKSKAAAANVEELDEFDEEEGLKPVNIDMNALANLLESFQSQDGPSGPSANLLRSVGFDMSRLKK